MGIKTPLVTIPANHDDGEQTPDSECFTPSVPLLENVLGRLKAGELSTLIGSAKVWSSEILSVDRALRKIIHAFGCLHRINITFGKLSSRASDVGYHELDHLAHGS
jgi:hypothetical protein